MSSSTVSNITKPLSLVGGILLLSGCVFHISPSVASVKQTQQLSLPSNNLEYLNVLSGAGSLEIKGSETATSISVDATIYTADIEDEYDSSDEESNIKQLNQNDYTVKALTHIHEFNEYFNTKLSDEDFDTIGGYVMQQFGHMPKRGESIMINSLQVTVILASKRRVQLLRLTKVPHEI